MAKPSLNTLRRDVAAGSITRDVAVKIAEVCGLEYSDPVSRDTVVTTPIEIAPLALKIMGWQTQLQVRAIRADSNGARQAAQALSAVLEVLKTLGEKV